MTVSLRQWGEDHCFDKSERHSVLVGKANGQRVPKLMLRGGDGKELNESTTFVQKVACSSTPRKPQGSKGRRVAGA